MNTLSDHDYSRSLIRLHANDNVLIAKSPLALGQRIEISGDAVRLRAQVPPGHKVAVCAIARGEPILKYNTVIGFATRDIEAGDDVHSHNTEFREYDRDSGFGLDVRPVDYVPEAERATFMGIVREDGRVGTRNYIGLFSSVNCSATAIKKIAEWFTPERLADYPNIDGVVAFAHDQRLRHGRRRASRFRRAAPDDCRAMRAIRTSAGALIVGLGCERNQIADLVSSQGLREGSLLRTMVMQDIGGTRKTIEAGIAMVKEMLPDANAIRREPVPASHIKVGLQCGGSDGFSGITANPALGAAMDILVRHGGTAILSETPEIYGVEHMLTRRAVSPRSRRKAARAHPNGGRNTPRPRRADQRRASAPATSRAGSRTSSRNRSARR